MQKNWRELIKPKRLEVDYKGLPGTYGKFECEPLERGFGITLGNALRRILLSSLQGAAITSVKVDGVLHEFSTIPGVLEDVTDVILNLKEIRFRMHGEGSRLLVIEKDGEGEVTAGAIHGERAGGGSESRPAHLHPCQGRPASHGARWSSRGKATSRRIAISTKLSQSAPVPIDAIFTPVKKVSYNVTQARVAQITDFDKLTIEIWTDGSVKTRRRSRLCRQDPQGSAQRLHQLRRRS